MLRPANVIRLLSIWRACEKADWASAISIVDMKVSIIVPLFNTQPKMLFQGMTHTDTRKAAHIANAKMMRRRFS